MMKKKIIFKKVIIVLLVVFLLLLPLGLEYLKRHRYSYWFEKNIQNGKYTIIGKSKIIDVEEHTDGNYYQLLNCKIMVINNSNQKKMTFFDSVVKKVRSNNDNYEIELNDEYIKITLYSFDIDKRTEDVYRIYYEDLEKINNQWNQVTPSQNINIERVRINITKYPYPAKI